MKKYFLLFLTVIIAAFMLCACSDDGDDVTDAGQVTDNTVTGDNRVTGSDQDPNNRKEDTPSLTPTASVTQDTDTDKPNTGDGSEKLISINVNKNSGDLNIDRKKVGDTGKSNLPDGWTIFVYLCGTDLESEHGMASGDLEEMLAATKSDKVRFIVETGGSQYWYNDVVDPGKLQRYLIQNGDMVLLDEQKSANMGDTETLADFLKWGLKSYASKHIGLIFWNHGGGSITGVCFDDLYDWDSLDLTDIDSALSRSLKNTGLRFDFIGFDACLMGTVETANILTTYADYMYASEEVEPGSGWDYKAIGDHLAQKPDSDALTLGKTVADSFLKACEREDDDAMTTLSVVDLSKTDELLTAFNSFAKDISEAGEDTAKRADIVRSIVSVSQFGSNNKTEGYTNMIDLGEMIRECSPYSKNADAAIKALTDAVVYSVTGPIHEGVYGLATYYPLSVQGSEELSFFGKICVSPYYLTFIDMLGSVGASGDMYWDYDEDTWFDDEGDWYWGDDWDYYDEENWDYLDDYEITGESPYITFEVEPTFEDNSYYFMLDEEGWYNTADVYGMVYVLSDDGKDIIEYGETYDIDSDWESGIFFDNFDGWWVSLPDGQNLATYIVDYDEDCIVYTSPVLLNGEETNLRLLLTEEGISIEGAWDGIEEYGASSRKIRKLKKGDRIVPMYYAMSADTFEDTEYYGDEYVFDGVPEIYYDKMYEGTYYFAFCIDDIYGDYYMTDFEEFSIDENGELIYDDWYGYGY